MPALVTTVREAKGRGEAPGQAAREHPRDPHPPHRDHADLLQLEVGAILETDHVNGSDVRVVVNTQLVAWAEFDVVAQRVAVRITELA